MTSVLAVVSRNPNFRGGSNPTLGMCGPSAHDEEPASIPSLREEERGSRRRVNPVGKPDPGPRPGSLLNVDMECIPCRHLRSRHRRPPPGALAPYGDGGASVRSALQAGHIGLSVEIESHDMVAGFSNESAPISPLPLASCRPGQEGGGLQPPYMEVPGEVLGPFRLTRRLPPATNFTP